MKSDGEEWRPVVGFEELYSVSSKGRVKSLRRPVRTRDKDGILRPGRHGKAKKWRAVALCKGGKSYSLCVHTLVLTAFVGPRPPGLVACHYNGIGADNRAENLRWGTHAANMADLVRHGTRLGKMAGSDNHKAKVAEKDIPAIRSRRASGEMLWAIARDYGVNDRNIAAICLRRTWRHVA